MNYKLTITLAVVIGLYGCQQEAENDLDAISAIKNLDDVFSAFSSLAK